MSSTVQVTSIDFLDSDILYIYILSLAASFSFCSWSFVKRNGNKVAHDLAHRQPYSIEGVLWETAVPKDILSRATDDMYAYIDNNLTPPPFPIKKKKKRRWVNFNLYFQ